MFTHSNECIQEYSTLEKSSGAHPKLISDHDNNAIEPFFQAEWVYKHARFN